MDSPAGPSKPMSKLALLAQKRREAAARKDGNTRLIPAEASSTRFLPSDSTPQSGDEAPPHHIAEASSAPRTPPDEPGEATSEDPLSRLFPSLTLGDGPSPGRTSRFFNILTRPTTTTVDPPDLEAASLHLPDVVQADHLHQRVESVFGNGAESPDDIVLKARGGRTGISGPGSGGLETSPERKSVLEPHTEAHQMDITPDEQSKYTPTFGSRPKVNDSARSERKPPNRAPAVEGRSRGPVSRPPKEKLATQGVTSDETKTKAPPDRGTHQHRRRPPDRPRQAPPS